MSESAIDVASLTLEERLQLLERVWDSLDHDRDVPVTPAQREELDRRIDSLEADIRSGETLGIPWEEVLQQLRSTR